MRDEIEIWNEGGEIDLRLLSGVGVILQFSEVRGPDPILSCSTSKICISEKAQNCLNLSKIVPKTQNFRDKVS